jgi:hypothetical protein
MTDDIEVERTVTVAVEALPFWHAHAHDATLRMWIFREIHGIEMPLTPATLEYMESAFQWIKKGKRKKPDLKVVK